MPAIALSHNVSSQETLQAQFLALLPRIENHARIYFRYVSCQGRRADQIAETVALAWKWLIRLNERGKDVSRFKMVFIYLVARAVKCGRRTTGMEKASDVMNPIAQRRHGFAVESLSPSRRPRSKGRDGLERQPHFDAFQDRLRENTVTPVVDQVQFRLDFPAWLGTLTPRERKIIRAMARNERTKDLSAKFTVSPGRISQLRQDFRNGWRRYCGDDADGAYRATNCVTA